MSGPGSNRRFRAAPVMALLLTLTLALVGNTPSHAQGTAEPVDVDLEEYVDVNLILIDFTVLDRADRTVADLTLEDFAVTVMGREMQPVSLDVNCPFGARPDPRAGARATALPEGATAPEQKIVLVFDYYHMPWATEAIDHAQRAIEQLTVGSEEHMVVALGESVTIMTEFTRDADRVHAALEQMRSDVRLYGGHYGRITEFRFFERIETLFNVLERFDGNKKVVLFSGPFVPDGFYHDVQYRKLSGLSARSRVQVYPVDGRGMTTGFELQDGISGPFELRRLANETGGRMTANTNDLSLAYARAHRDNSCTYTIGFYDRRIRLDRERRYKVWVNKRGLRAVHSLYYVVRSRKEQRASTLYTAGMAPEVFLDSGVQATVELTQRLEKRWAAVITTKIRLDPDQLFPDDRPWELRGWIRRPWGTNVGKFKHAVELPSFLAGREAVPTVTVDESIKLRPGRYTVNLALVHPASSVPLAATLQIEVPEIAPTTVSTAAEGGR